MEALSEIAAALNSRSLLTVVTGSPGSGKSALGRAVVGRLEGRSIGALLEAPISGFDDFLARVLDDFGVVDRQRVAGAGVQDLTRILDQFLGSLVPLHGRAVIIVDDAHALEPDVLEHVRSLLESDVNRQRSLQLILIGQPELQNILERIDLVELGGRQYRHVQMRSLERREERHDSGGGSDGRVGGRATQSAGSSPGQRSQGMKSGRRWAAPLAPSAVPISSLAAVTALVLVSIAVGAVLARRANDRTPTAVAANLPAATPSVNDRSRTGTATPPSLEPGGSPLRQEPTEPREKFALVVASFRTAPSAAAAAADVAGLGVPAFTRTNSGWHQVVVGPYGSRNDALEGQRRLVDAKLLGTQLEMIGPTNVSVGSISGQESSPTPRHPAAEGLSPGGVQFSAGSVAVESTARVQTADMVERARSLARVPNVKELERLRASRLKQSTFGDPRHDPVVMELDRYLDEARRLQLTVDARDLRRSQSSEYREAMLRMIPDLDETSASLASWSIGNGARPDSRASAALASRLRAIEPPSEMAAMHERLCASLESLTRTLSGPPGENPVGQASQALTAITQAKGALHEFLRSPETVRSVH